MALVRVGMNPKALAQATKYSLAEQQRAQPWTRERKEALHEALETIAAACDGALGRDDLGFCKDHWSDGHHYAETDPASWSADDVELANEVARHYRNTQITYELASRIWPIEFPPKR